MSEKDNGGAAFPIADLHGMPFGGMSLRDWYAGMVLQGHISNPEITDKIIKEFKSGAEAAQAVAEICYKFADAMIEERNNAE